MKNSILDRLKLLTREELVDILQTKGGYLCYDDERIHVLRDVLLKDIETGVLPPHVLPEFVISVSQH